MKERQIQRAGFVFILVFILPLFFPITQASAVTSSSTNYKIDGGQVSPISGSGESGNFSIETGGNPISGESSGADSQVQQGAPLDSATPGPAENTYAGGSLSTLLALGIEVRPISPSMVEIVFETNTSMARARIDYGTLGNYNLHVGDAERRKYHRFLLYNLSPGTQYNYSIHLEVNPNKTNDIGPFFFTTAPIITAVPNVSKFTAIAGESSISLSWQNPIFNNYKRTVVVKKTNSYSTDVSDGEVIFSDTGIFYEDVDVMPDTLYFYTAFVESADGRISSGVIQSTELGVVPQVETPEGEIIPAEPIPLPPGVVPTPETGIREVLINIFTLLKQRVTEGLYRLFEIFNNLSMESRKKVNDIKQGLIDQYGRLQRDIYETLAPSELKELEELIGENIPEEFTKETINTITVVNLLGDEDVDWRIFADSDVLLTIPRSIFLKDVDTITVAISTDAYVLKYNKDNDAYEAIIKSPHAKGEYYAVVQIIYTDNTFEEVSRTVLVDPYGMVYFREYKGWSWTKPWQFIMTKQVPIGGANVRLEMMTRTKEWVLWPARLYNQFNPIVTGEDGAFAFVAPNGTYRLIVDAEGFKNFQSKPFEVEKQIVNVDIKLEKRLSTARIITLLILGIMILGILGIISKNRVKYAKN